jgi:hypothetical protein
MHEFQTSQLLFKSSSNRVQFLAELISEICISLGQPAKLRLDVNKSSHFPFAGSEDFEVPK